jgi:hypothetical protein
MKKNRMNNKKENIFQARKCLSIENSTDSKRDSKITKINFPVGHIKFSLSPIPTARPQVLLKNLTDC